MEFTGARWCYPVPLFHPCAGPDPPGGQLGWSRGGSEAPGATKPAATSMRNGTSTTREYQRHHAQRYADGNSAAGQQAALPTTPSTGFPSSSCRAAGRSPLGRRRRRAAPNRHAGFDEAGAGNVPTGAGLRPGAKAPDEPPDPTGGAPALDPTDERRLETELRRGVRHRHWRKPPGTATPYAYRHRASRRLYVQILTPYER